MAGYVIHVAVAKEYLRKHENKKENYIEFMEGVIYPDSVKDKSLTHYGIKSSYTNIYEFLKHNEITNSFNRGYFLHLITDYLFYNKYLDRISKDLYNDYDLLNRYLVGKYDIKLPESVKHYAKFKDEGEFKILSRELIDKFIEDVSNYDLDEIKKETYEDPAKWTTINLSNRD